MAIVLWVVDAVVSWYQQSLLDQRQRTRARLQRAALFHVRAEVADLGCESGEIYRLTLAVENAFPEEPLLMMRPSMQAFIQVGTIWEEIPSRPAADQADPGLELTGRRTYSYQFGPTPAVFEELIPGYMHMRFINSMLISEKGRSVQDMAERSDNYYLYVRPHRCRQAASAKDTPSAVWIPMPPH